MQSSVRVAAALCRPSSHLVRPSSLSKDALQIPDEGSRIDGMSHDRCDSTQSISPLQLHSEVQVMNAALNSRHSLNAGSSTLSTPGHNQSALYTPDCRSSKLDQYNVPSSSSSSSSSVLWAPHMPIVFADTSSTRQTNRVNHETSVNTPAVKPTSTVESSRTIRSDFTWKRGDHIVFGPHLEQRRTYATNRKPPPPPPPPRYISRPKRSTGDVANPSDLEFLSTPSTKPYQPRAPRSTASVVDPNDLSFLDLPSRPAGLSPSSPAISKPDRPVITDESDQSAPPASRGSPLPSNVAFDSRGPSELPTASDPSKPRSSTPAVPLGPPPSLDERIQQELDHSSPPILEQQDLGIHQHLSDRLHRTMALLKEIQAEIKNQEQQSIEEKKYLEDTVETKDFLINNLTNQLAKQEQRQKTMRKELDRANERAQTFKRTADALVEEKEHPRRLQEERLARSLDHRLEQQDRHIQQDATNRRASQRLKYSDYQDFYVSGTQTIGNWLATDIKAQMQLDRKVTRYWEQAAVRLDSWIKDTRAKDDFRAWDLSKAATDQALSANDSSTKNDQFESQIKHRDRILDALSSHLHSSALRSTESAMAYEDKVYTFDATAWTTLKRYSHDARHLTRVLRLQQDTPPGLLAHQLFVDANAAKGHMPLLLVYRPMINELYRLKRQIAREQDPLRSLNLRRRYDIVAAQASLLTISNSLSHKIQDMLEAEWLQKQSLASTAASAAARPLLSMLGDLRTRIDSGRSKLVELGINAKRDVLKLDGIFEARGLIRELENLTYRNTFLAEQQGALDETQLQSLRGMSYRNFTDSVGRLKVALRSVDERGLRAWVGSIFGGQSKHKGKGVELGVLDEPDPFKLLYPRKPDKGLSARKEGRASTTSNVSSADAASPSSHGAALSSHLHKDVTIDTKTVDSTTGEDFGAFDSPMDFFEASASAKPIEDVSVAESPQKTDSTGSSPASGQRETVDAIDDHLETADTVEMEEHAEKTRLSTPNYKQVRQSTRDLARRPFAQIQPRKGVLPKPDYIGRSRRRLGLKSTMPRKHVLEFDSVDLSEKIWIAQDDRQLCVDNHQSPYDSTTQSAPVLDQSHATARTDLNRDTAFTGENDMSNTSHDSVTPGPTYAAASTGTQGGQAALGYQIPSSTFRNTLLASQTSGAAFWKYSLYRGPNGEKITVHYCTKLDQAEKQAKLFLDEQIIGFDAEWEPGAKLDSGSIKDNLSLIQISSENRIALFHVAAFYGETPEELMPPSLRLILESPSIAKAGVNISGDYTRLRRCFGIQGQGLFELSHLYKVVKYSETEPTKVDKKLAKLADQVQDVLYLPMAKGAVRTSAWSRRLSPEQIEYAATDAYAGYRLYHALEAKRKALDPTPPRPALYELGMPLLLGDGKPPPKKTKLPKVIAKDSDVVFEGLTEPKEEDFDEEQKDVDDAEESNDQFYSCDSDFEGTEALVSSSSSTKSLGTRTCSESTAVPLRRPREEADAAAPGSSGLAEAERWASERLSSVDSTCKSRATAAWLRAYALWHIQNLGIYDVARILREPPLAPSSVAQYVLEAIKHDDLPFEPDRARQALKFIPASAQWRYARIYEKIRTAEGL